MWTILQFDKNKFESLKRDFSKKLGNDFMIYYFNAWWDVVWVIPKVFTPTYRYI